MRRLFIGCLILISCASLKELFTVEPKYEYCGNVDTLQVYQKYYSVLSCKDVLATTEAAYSIFRNKESKILNDTWRVEYMWGMISIDDPYACTYPNDHLIRIREQEPRSILHELMHAYMFETHSGGRNQHRKMCADKHWLELEKDFEVRSSYCQFEGKE